MNEDDDDPVVQEVPVYLSQLLAEKLFLFQYPIRPAGRSYDEMNVLQASIKPDNQEVKLELEIDTNSSNYDASKGEQLALNVDGVSTKKGDKKEDERVFKKGIMDRQELQSTRAVKDSSNYGVAVVQDGEVHITPIRGIVHLRPTFSYLDKSDKRMKEENKDQSEDAQSGEEEEEAKQVTVKFARQESDRLKRAREKSFGYLCKKSAEEPWYYTDFHNTLSDRAELERSKLYCTKTGETVCEMSINVEEYKKILLPPEEDEENAADCKAAQTQNVSLSNLHLMPLLDQVKIVIREAKVLQFTHLLSLLAKDADPANVLRVVQQVAVLVRGNWVVRSDLLYPKDTFSSISGVPAELMCRGRDYVLYLLTQNSFVDRTKVMAVVKLPTEEVKEILTQVARLQPSKGWELMLPFDREFIKKYPEVVQRQQVWWEAKQKQLSDSFKEGTTSPSKTRRKTNQDSDKETSESESKLPTPQGRLRKKSQRESISSDNESGAEEGARQRNSCKVPRRTVKATAVKVEPKNT